MNSAFEPYDKETLRILGEMSIITNPNYIRVISEIPEHFKSGLFMSMSISFNYGLMIGKRQERDLKKWNATACFFNMQAYAKAHNGELPKTQEDLKKWVQRND